jgi:hypothetical protein
MTGVAVVPKRAGCGTSMSSPGRRGYGGGVPRDDVYDSSAIHHERDLGLAPALTIGSGVWKVGFTMPDFAWNR